MAVNKRRNPKYDAAKVVEMDFNSMVAAIQKMTKDQLKELLLLETRESHLERVRSRLVKIGTDEAREQVKRSEENGQ